MEMYENEGMIQSPALSYRFDEGTGTISASYDDHFVNGNNVDEIEFFDDESSKNNNNIDNDENFNRRRKIFLS